MSRSFIIFEVRNQNKTLTPTDMAKVVYKSYNQNDNLLFPHCIGDFIPENDPVRVLDAIVEHLDISAIEAGDRSSRKPWSDRSNMIITSRGSAIEGSDS